MFVEQRTRCFPLNYCVLPVPKASKEAYNCFLKVHRFDQMCESTVTVSHISLSHGSGNFGITKSCAWLRYICGQSKLSPPCACTNRQLRSWWVGKPLLKSSRNMLGQCGVPQIKPLRKKKLWGEVHNWHYSHSGAGLFAGYSQQLVSATIVSS